MIVAETGKDELVELTSANVRLIVYALAFKAHRLAKCHTRIAEKDIGGPITRERGNAWNVALEAVTTGKTIAVKLGQLDLWNELTRKQGLLPIHDRYYRYDLYRRWNESGAKSRAAWVERTTAEVESQS